MKHTWLHYLLVMLGFMSVVIYGLNANVLAIARGYTTNDPGLQTGMVVAVSSEANSPDTVERATQATSKRVVGIVTTVDTSLVAVGSNASKVFVENEGQVDGYVSDINGKIDKGDQLVLSPLKGILMKGNNEVATVVIAIAADKADTGSPYTYVVNGKTANTNISKINLNLNHIGSNSTGITISDSPLVRVGRSIVGKEVGEIRVLIAMIIFIIVLIAEGSILYGAISSALAALGRNPLARKIIRAELVWVIFVAIGVLIVGLGAVYGILWV